VKATGCPITVYVIRCATRWPDGSARARRCGKPVDRYGLCAKHADDKERLS
jgi:hypothetical protein